MRQIRAGHLTSVHPPFDGRIFHKECTTLARAGYEVVLIAPGQRDEVMEGVRVRSVPIPNGRAERMTRTVWEVFKAALEERLDICHFHDPELLPIGVLLKLSGRRVIYDVHENVPDDILNKSYINGRWKTIIARLADWTERIAATVFDGIIAATPAIAKRFPAKKTAIVQNFPVVKELVLADLRPYSARPPLITYIGAMTAVRGVKEMIQAMTCIPPTLGAKLVFAGSCDSDLESEMRQMEGWRHVEFPGWLSQEGVARLLSNTRVGLVLLHPIRGFAESYPIKMFEYMAAGVPVIASDFPLWRKIIEEARCGILVDPLDPNAIASAIQWLFEHPEEAEQMGKKGLEAVCGRYNWSMEGEQLTSLYRTVLGYCSGNEVSASQVVR